MRGLLVSPLGLLVGLSLGALGGGGSVLAVPALVFGAGETPQAATTTSLLVVGVAALMGVGSHWRAGRVRLGAGLLFGAAGVGGSAVGTALNHRVDPDALLLAFSGIMVVAAIGMWRQAERPCPDEGPGRDEEVAAPTAAGVGVINRAPARPALRVDARTVVRVVLAGTAVGLLTGFFGVGGGFVVVPALVLALGFSMPDAVGTSLVVIALNAGVALALRAGTAEVVWADALPFLVMAIVGTLIGRRIADRVPAAVLTRGFVVLLVAVAALTAATSVVALV